ncbi:MAG: hypothetical protein WB797_09360 [Nocardioides sp.]
MSALGAPPASPTDVTPGGEPSSDIPLWVIGVAVVVVLALAGALGFAILSQRGSSPDRPAAQTGRTFPTQWDRRIAPYARIAARERGLEFRHPVAVRFLSPAKFKKGVTTDAEKLTKGDRADIRNVTGLLRALGLITGNVNLFRASNDVKGDSTLAYYSFADKRITIRGHRLTPSVRATLVHELTHVLQDQHFHVGARLKRLDKQSKHGRSTTAWSVLDSIVEGDAQRVEHLYAASLPAKQRQALVAGQNHEATQAGRQLTQVPKVLITMMSSPYTLGEGLVQAVAADGGNSAVDHLLRHPPTHESSLLDPFRVLAGHTGAARVALPRLRPGERKFDSGELGVLTWYFMLAERLPLTQALAAADGWNGDAYVAYVHDGSSCARMAYTGRTPLDTSRMYSALQGWVAAAPGSPASVTRAGDVVHFQSCDPGTAAQVGKDDSEQAAALLTTREGLGIGIMRGGAPAARARCIAGRLVQTFSVAALNDPSFQTDHPNATTQLQQIGAACR